MIVDVFPFDREFDMLDCRIYQLRDVVDQFVAMEGNLSFSGIPKPFHLTENRDRYRDVRLEIIQSDLRDTSGVTAHGDWIRPETRESWVRENKQRSGADSLVRSLPHDTVMVYGDVDEIPIPDVIASEHFTPTVLVMLHLIYSTRQAHGAPWFGPVIGFRGELPLPATTRERRTSFRHFWPGGWHLSWFGEPEDRVRKLEGFSHQELRSLGEAVGTDFPSRMTHVNGDPLYPVECSLPRWIEEGKAPETWTRSW